MYLNNTEKVRHLPIKMNYTIKYTKYRVFKFLFFQVLI